MIRWLHLSDVHEHKGDGHPRIRMYDNIIKEVNKRADKPDLVFLTGDLAFSGTKAEYDSLQTGFIEPLRAALPDALFFPVPGNHDLMRETVVPPRDWTSNDKQKEIFQQASEAGAKKRTEALYPRFSNYADFEQGFAAWDKSGGHWLKSDTGAAVWRGQVGDRTVAVVGLNTAWLSHDDQDWGKLTPGRDLLERALDLAQKDVKPDLLFVLGHHPLEAMEIEQSGDGLRLRQRLEQNHALYLHGHMHESEAHAIGDRYANTLAIQAPSAFQAADSKVWRNGIMWGEADVPRRKLRLQPLKWNNGHSEFKFDNEAGANRDIEGNYFVLNLPGANEPDDLAPAQPSAAPALQLPPGWEEVNKTFLSAKRGERPSNGQIIDFFDGALPGWKLALTSHVPPRDIVPTLVSKLENWLDNAAKPGVLLLTGAGGDGKSTAALHAAAQLVDSGRWTCLYRRAASAITPPNLFRDLPQRDNHGWLVLIDDADNGKAAILEAVKQATARTDIHLLLVARLADWDGAGTPDGLWRDSAEFTRQELKGLTAAEAGRIVAGWRDLGDDAMGKLSGQSEAAAAAVLLAHARDGAARPEEGALLGALLTVRRGEDLPDRVLKTLCGLDRSKVCGVYSVRDVYIAIAAMHAENQLYLTPRILAKTMGCDENTLQTRALRPLRLEAMLDGGDAFLLTRHRRIAEAAMRKLAEEGEDPWRFMPLLASGARKLYIQTKQDDAHTVAWTFNLARHFADRPGRESVAQAVAQAVYLADPNNYGPLTACAQIYRKTKNPAGAFRILLSTGDKFTSRRDVLYEWGTVAGALGEHALDVWLVARSLADGPGDMDNQRYKLSLAGLGVAFEQLHLSEGDPAFLTARTACGQLGLRLPELNEKDMRFFTEHADAGARAGIREMTPDAAVKAIRGVVIAAADLVETQPETPERPEINPLYFEKRLGDPDGYSYSQLLRAVSPPKPRSGAKTSK